VSEPSFSQDTGTPLVVAHRGANVEAPENTIEAFERAIEAGADAVEFDVRITADGAAVVMHDPDVSRTTDGEGLCCELTLSDIRSLRIRGDHEVPTLGDALRAISGRVGADIEIKNIPSEPDFEPGRQRGVDAVVAALDDVGFRGPVLITSFNPMVLAHARRVAPELERGLLSGLDAEAWAALAFAEREGHGWVLPVAARVFNAGGDYPAAVHAAGLRLGTWIVDDAEEAVSLLREGCDAVATNDPARIVSARRRAFGS
jgi:glycerophosphoryl diester phosphodiesterase